MEFGEVVASRRMVRSFEPGRSVSSETRDRLLRAAHRAPSAGGTKGWSFLVIETPTDHARFWDATADAPAVGDDAVAARRRRWFERMRQAPLLIVVWSSKSLYRQRYAEPDKGCDIDDETAWSAPYWHVDAGFAALLMLLSAVDEGLGACFFGVPRRRVEALRASFGVPASWEPVGVVAVGHPGGSASPRHTPRHTPRRTPRRTLSDAVHHGRW